MCGKDFGFIDLECNPLALRASHLRLAGYSKINVYMTIAQPRKSCTGTNIFKIAMRCHPSCPWISEAYLSLAHPQHYSTVLHLIATIPKLLIHMILESNDVFTTLSLKEY